MHWANTPCRRRETFAINPVVWCRGPIANKRLVLTLPARRNFGIRARHTNQVVVFALFSRLY
jgi:hypothetical protein